MTNLFSACMCDITHLKHLARSPWMRVLPWLGLYRCENCGRSQLHPERAVEQALQKRVIEARVAGRAHLKAKAFS